MHRIYSATSFLKLMTNQKIILFAATAEDVHGGDYIGPGGLMETRGYPKHVESSEESHDRVAAQKLWSVSEELTGVKFAFDRPAAEEMVLTA